MEEVVVFTDHLAQLLRNVVQLGIAVVALVLSMTGRALRPVYQIPHRGRKRLAGFAFWWRTVEPGIGSGKSPELTITGILWNSSGGGSIHIGRHVFNLMPGMPQEHSRLGCRLGIFYNRPKDFTAIRPEKEEK